MMNITTRTQGFDKTRAIDRFVEHQAEMALARLAEDVIAVDVFIKDANGPKGGVDKQALIRVQLRHRQVIALETEHENLFGAVRKGLKRTKRALRKQLRKSHRIGKQRISERLGPAELVTAN